MGVSNLIVFSLSFIFNSKSFILAKDTTKYNAKQIFFHIQQPHTKYTPNKKTTRINQYNHTTQPNKYRKCAQKSATSNMQSKPLPPNYHPKLRFFEKLLCGGEAAVLAYIQGGVYLLFLFVF
jgi:hypothetical protein